MIFRIQNEKIDNFFCNLQDINFVKIDLRHAISVLVLDVRTGTFLFPKSTGLMRILTQLNTLVNTISPLFFVLLVQSCIIFVFHSFSLHIFNFHSMRPWPHCIRWGHS